MLKTALLLSVFSMLVCFQAVVNEFVF